jgi:hypothetical protein
MKKFAHLLIILPLIYSCSKTDPKEALVQIGKNTITKSQYDAFDKVNKMYPVETAVYFPLYRSAMTHLVETELIYRQTSPAFRDSLKATADWKLKEQYYPAQLFLLDFLSTNLGIPDEQISAFYASNKDSFKVTITNDSTKKDSTYYRSLTDVKNQIIDTLFLRGNKPDSLFLTRFDSLAEPQYINDQWLMHVRQTLPNFFMNKIYAEVFGKPYPDSLSDIYGDGKYITQADFDVILNWIPEIRRDSYEAPERRRDLVEWLVKWKLFSNYANTKQFNNPQVMKKMMDWAWKLNVVYSYVNTVLAPITEALVVIDSSMLLYALYDDNGYVTTTFKDNAFSAKERSLRREQTLLKIDSIISSFRLKTGVTVLQGDYFDIKNQRPDSLAKQAEALRDSGKTDAAKEIYSTLIREYAFTPEGNNAFIEMAKLQTEQQLYTQAIDNYRKYLINNNEKDKRCNTFFMIGFIYDEYLEKPIHAEANYKWVLRNTPDCELSDDAEFMMLHLNEPMSSVEELRDETARQGRKVEPAEEITGTDTLKS